MLLLLPFDRQLDWKRPPLAVIGLILANLLIFFLFQWGDQQKTIEALEYYRASDLPRLELPAYRQILKDAERLGELEAFDAAVEFRGDGGVRYGQLQLPLQLEFDADFHEARRGGTLLAPDAPEWPLWEAQRNTFEAKLNASFTHRYSLRPALADPITLLSHMFMHGGVMHLVGNMVFLFIVGFVVEAAIGSAAFLVIYLVSGLGAAGLDLLVQGTDLVYHLGASGAVSGVMGGYAVLFGLRRIHFFYNVLFWFDRIKAPALLMLPLWLANEAWQLSNGDSNVNYWAHIAGLLTGALAIAALRLFTRQIDEGYMDEPERAAAHARELEKALDLMAQLRHGEAKPIIRRLLQASPHDPELNAHLFTASRSLPESEDFHQSGRALLLGASTPPALRLRTFTEYVGATRPRLSTTEALELARRLADEGGIEAAERLTLAILRRRPDHPKLVPVLKRLVDKAPAERARRYRQALLRFPVEG